MTHCESCGTRAELQAAKARIAARVEFNRWGRDLFKALGEFVEKAANKSGPTATQILCSFDDQELPVLHLWATTDADNPLVRVAELEAWKEQAINAAICETGDTCRPNAVLPGRPIAYLHASPDCTHFSKARGSKPKKKEIRALAWVVVDWAGKRRPSVITLENVEEFRDWGPLGKDEQPCQRRRGETFKEWVKALESLGYVVQHRELRACDYGAPTTRKRLFVVARCDGKPIAWPEKTHGSSFNIDGCTESTPRSRAGGITRGTAGRSDASSSLVGSRNRAAESHSPASRDELSARGVCSHRGRVGRVLGRSEETESGPHSGENAARTDSGGRDGRSHNHRSEALKPYRTAAECIDWSIPMLSIFATSAEAKAWGKQHSAGTPRRPLKPKTLERIARGLVKFVIEHPRPFIVPIENFGWGGSPRSADEPLSTVTASPKGGKHAVVDVALAPVIAQLAHGGGGTFGNGRENSVETPLGTVHAGGNNHAVVGATLAPYTVPNLGEREGQAPRCGSVEQPLPTVTAKGNGARLVAATLQTLNHGGDEHRAQSPEEPIHTVTAGPGGSSAGAAHAMGVTCAYLSHLYGTNRGSGGDVDQPLPTVTGSGNHAALVAAFLATYYGNSKDAVAIDRPAPTVVGKDRIQLVTVLIDGQTYVITDIAMRMLTPRELARCQGFPMHFEWEFELMTRDEVCVAALATGDIVVDTESGEVVRTRGPGGVRLASPERVAGTNCSGYLVMNLSANGVKRQVRLHRLVWIAANGIPSDGLVVAHVNNVKTDNRIANLKLLSAAENSTEAARDGLYGPSPTTKLDVEVRRQLADEYRAGGITRRRLAERYGISLSRVDQIIRDCSYVIDRQRDGTRVTKADQVKLIGNSVPPAFMRALVRANVVDQGVLDHQQALAEASA